MVGLTRRATIVGGAAGFAVTTRALALPGKQRVFASKGLAIEGYDAVAYFVDGTAVEGNPAHAFEWEGATWRFKNANHRDRFAADPMRFMPQYGGHCSVSMANRRVTPGDPKLSGVLRDKLYLNGTKDASERFWRDPSRFIPLANQHWDSLASL